MSSLATFEPRDKALASFQVRCWSGSTVWENIQFFGGVVLL